MCSRGDSKGSGGTRALPDDALLSIKTGERNRRGGGKDGERKRSREKRVEGVVHK